MDITGERFDLKGPWVQEGWWDEKDEKKKEDGGNGGIGGFI